MSYADRAAESSHAEWVGSQREAEIERLRELVKEAYLEAAGANPRVEYNGQEEEWWELSRAKRALDGIKEVTE